MSKMDNFMETMGGLVDAAGQELCPAAAFKSFEGMYAISGVALDAWARVMVSPIRCVFIIYFY